MYVDCSFYLINISSLSLSQALKQFNQTNLISGCLIGKNVEEDLEDFLFNWNDDTFKW